MATTLEARATTPPADAGVALLLSGHRVFFLGAALSGFGSPLAWLLAWHGLLPLRAAWHGHELIWGVASAAIAGVLSAAMQLTLALAMALRALNYGLRSALREPIDLVLHAAHAFMPLGLLLSGLALVAPSLGFALAPIAGLHALTAGAIGGMIVAIVSRASRGHAGLPQHASTATICSYGMVFGGALVRVLGPLAAPWLADGGRLLISVAGTARALAWLAFAVEYAPMWLRARRDGKAG